MTVLEVIVVGIFIIGVLLVTAGVLGSVDVFRRG